jgi:glycosyltransferase involved in cell wall biosynthesis
MKIIYCLPDTYKPGGIERVVSLKANYLVEHAGYEIIIITTGQLDRKPFYHFSEMIKFYDLGINYDEMLSEHFIKRILIRRQKRKEHKKRLSRLLHTLKADIVISTLTHEADFLPKIKDGSKKLLEFHFCKGHKRLMANAFKFYFITKLAYYYRAWIEENIIIPKYDQFVVLTEEDKNQWIHKIKNVIAIPNILPFESEDKAELKNKKLIAVGRLDAQKGFDRLIDIWAIVSTKYPDWELNIYGEGSDMQILKRQIKSLAIESTCHINTPVKNISEKYLESSIFVMTSRYEGMPMTMLEAMSFGLPSVSYDFKCGPKDLILNNINGNLVQEGDIQQFVKRLFSIMEDSEKCIQMGVNAKEQIRKYSVNIVMKHWFDLFNRLKKD